MLTGFALLVLAVNCCGQTAPPNWGAGYGSCVRHSELLNTEHLDIAVRIATSDARLARQFARAMDFWKGVLDLDWHEAGTGECAMALVDGKADLFESEGHCRCIAARSQIPDRAGFGGLIAFNPASKLSDREMFVIAVHEIGHIFGLGHNPSGASVMFFLPFDDTAVLDASDLQALAARHRLRGSGMAVAEGF
jgi:hypothetical protein